jgi:hypothetical protein
MGAAADIIAAIEILAQSGHAGAVRVAAGLRARLDSNVITFEGALGKAPGWRAAWRRGQVARLLDSMAERYFRGLRYGRPLVNEVTNAAVAYQRRGGWRKDKKTGHRPDGVDGAIADVLRLNGGEFPSVATLRRVYEDIEARRRLSARDRCQDYPDWIIRLAQKNAKEPNR